MRATIYKVQRDLPGTVSIVARPRGGDWLTDEIAALSREGITVVVSMLPPEEAAELGLTDEGECCDSHQIMFVQIPIADRSVPPDKEQFLSTVQRLAALVREGQSIGVHCRASIGRSTLLAAALLVELGTAPGDAFIAIQHARGCPVPDTPDQRRWIEENVSWR
jgi:protein-tyrosine phosphatase